MIAPYRQIIAACWVVFGAYWTWTARLSRPATRSESRASSALSGVLLWLGFASIGLSVIRPRPLLPLVALPLSPALEIAGTSLVVLGVAFAIWARTVLGVEWSRVARVAAGQRLVVTGPYRVVRNPIYSGMLLAAFGVALASGSAVAAAGMLPFFAGLWRKSRVEERLLAAEFGEQYAAYARRVKAIIPFVL